MIPVTYSYTLNRHLVIEVVEHPTRVYFKAGKDNNRIVLDGEIGVNETSKYYEQKLPEWLNNLLVHLKEFKRHYLSGKPYFTTVNNSVFTAVMKVDAKQMQDSFIILISGLASGSMFNVYLSDMDMVDFDLEKGLRRFKDILSTA